MRTGSNPPEINNFERIRESYKDNIVVLQMYGEIFLNQNPHNRNIRLKKALEIKKSMKLSTILSI